MGEDAAIVDLAPYVIFKLLNQVVALLDCPTTRRQNMYTDKPAGGRLARMQRVPFNFGPCS
jgi:hypothetical protein